MPPKFTFTAGTTLPESAEEVASELAFITRSVSPLLIELGFPDDLKIVRRTKHEWLEEKLLPNSGTVNGAILAATTTLVLDSPQGSNFQLGDEVQIEGSVEIMTVVAPAPTATDVELVRGAKGTTAVDIADNTVLKRLSNPALEDETAPGARPISRTRIANYTQIIRGTATVTRSMEKTDLLAGVEDELEHQVDLVMKDLIRDVAHTVVRGRAEAANPEGTTTQVRTMNGIIHSLLGGANPSIIDAGGAGVDEALLNLLLQDMWTKGGEPRLLAAPPVQRRRISALLQGRQRFRVEDSTLGSVVERYISDFGEIDILAPDIFIPDDRILVLDTAKIRVVKLGDEGDPFEVMPLAVTGLTSNREVVGEFGLEIQNAGDGGHGMLQNLLAT